jgi:hypothetical protein
MTEHGNGKKPKRTYSKHGLCQLKAAVKTLGSRVVDRRTRTGQALARWRSDLLADMGGPEQVSTQQLAVVELAVKSKLILDSIDGWLLRQPSLINLRKRALLPVVRERQALADGLMKCMTLLGLERRKREVLTLANYAEKHFNGKNDLEQIASLSGEEPARQRPAPLFSEPSSVPAAPPTLAQDGPEAGAVAETTKEGEGSEPEAATTASSLPDA